MWNSALKLSNSRIFSVLSRRCYLTEAYRLDGEWAKRLETPVLRQVKIENLYVDLDLKFNQQKKISAVDVDIFTNKVNDANHQDEMADVLAKLRRTEEATKIFDSTQYAVVRNFMENDNLDFLINILNERETYGVFLDHYTANIVLNKLILCKNYKMGARIAVINALQEDFSSPITNAMSLFTCYKFLENLEEFDDLKPPPEPEPVEGQPKKKKKDEIKIRVRYLKNPYFDDHFDIKNTNHLIGKTFLLHAPHLNDETLANNFKLLGYAMYEKFEGGNKFLEQSKDAKFFKEIVEKVKQFATNLDENEEGKKFFENVESLKSLQDETVEPILEKFIKSAVAQNEQQDMENQKKIFDNWIIERDDKLQKEILRHQRIQRLLAIEKIQETMEDEEKKLWFFENEDKIDLEIDKTQKKDWFYPRKWHGKRKTNRVIEEGYIPPDVDSRRNITK